MVFDSDGPRGHHGFVNRTQVSSPGLVGVLLDVAAESVGGGPVRSRETRGAPGGVYVISVAARILEMHPQTLRKYERVGLVRPTRTAGMLRLYSEIDIARLRLIKHLVGDLGLNLAGVQLVLEVFTKLLAAKAEIGRGDIADARQALDDRLDDIISTLYSR